MDFDRFHEVLDTLISLNHLLRVEQAHFQETLSRREWAEEYCVVSCDIGRSTGKTEYIKRRAKEGDLVVTFNEAMCSEFRSGIACKVLTARQLGKGSVGMRFKTIFVDEPKLVFKMVDRDLFFNFLAHGKQTFVMLGAN